MDTLQRFSHVDCDITEVDGFNLPMLPDLIFLPSGSWNGNRDWVQGYPAHRSTRLLHTRTYFLVPDVTFCMMIHDANTLDTSHHAVSHA